MKEYFSIGELAELFGLNIQTLYYYDSVGIFSPRERNEKNGRRKYEFDQIYELATVSYMRRLGYSLEEIKESRTSLNSNRAVDIMKQRSQELRRQWQELLNIDEAIQRKIRFMEQEMDGICLDEIAVKHFEDRKFISIGDEELLYRENSFYFYPTIAFYEGDRKYFGAYLYPDDEELPKTIPQSRIQIIPEGDFGACRIPSGACERPGRTLSWGLRPSILIFWINSWRVITKTLSPPCRSGCYRYI